MIPDLLWILIGLQMVMGLFDTVFHHELTERLAWRPSQRQELRLHAVRNLLYAVLFGLLGWAEPYGAFAICIGVILIIEVIITQWDFVEEDLSRKLPATERITHTLLALNYGAILILLAPILLEWASRTSGVSVAYHGFWSWLCVMAVVGTLIFAVRDWLAARRSDWLAPPDAAGLVPTVGGSRTILVTGATGFIGHRLVQVLRAAGYQVIALVRSATAAEVLGAPITLVDDLDHIDSDTRIHGIVNLAGDPIANFWWTKAKRERIIESRLALTSSVNRLIARLSAKPEVLINGSAIGWYGLRGDECLDEASGFDPCFSHDVCAAWETEARNAKKLGLRVVLLRIGLVLGVDGGFMSRLLTPFEFCLGGPIGSGQQWMSWIDRDDLVRLICFALETPGLKGPVNGTAPDPVTNQEFSAALGRALNRPSWARLPAPLVRLLGGDMAEELLLSGQRVRPLKAMAHGFRFGHPDIDHALRALLCRPPTLRQPDHAPRALPVETGH